MPKDVLQLPHLGNTQGAQPGGQWHYTKQASAVNEDQQFYRRSMATGSDSLTTEEVGEMGKLFDIIQEHMDAQPYGVSQRQVADRLGVSPTTLKNWRTPTGLVDKSHLQAISKLTGVPYYRVLDALLEDIGYLASKDAGRDSKERGAAG